jgi:hypothetical protein
MIYNYKILVIIRAAFALFGQLAIESFWKRAIFVTTLMRKKINVKLERGVSFLNSFSFLSGDFFGII